MQTKIQLVDPDSEEDEQNESDIFFAMLAFCSKREVGVSVWQYSVYIFYVKYSTETSRYRQCAHGF